MVRALIVAMVVMGVLILAGTGLLVSLLITRAPGSGGSAAPAAAAMLDEPAGTHIAAASGGADALVLRLSGGGPDRVVVLDARTGRMLGRVGLAR